MWAASAFFLRQISELLINHKVQQAKFKELYATIRS
jgi:hypothetical protein